MTVSYSTWSGGNFFCYTQHVTSCCNQVVVWRSKWGIKHCCAATTATCMAVHFYLERVNYWKPKGSWYYTQQDVLVLQKTSKEAAIFILSYMEFFQTSACGGGRTLQSNTSRFIYHHKLQKLWKREELVISRIQQQEVLLGVHNNYQVSGLLGLALWCLWDLQGKIVVICVTLFTTGYCTLSGMSCTCNG